MLLSTSPFFEGESASEKVGNWKIKFEKLENKMERTLEKKVAQALIWGAMVFSLFKFFL